MTINNSILSILQSRGLIAQKSHEKKVQEKILLVPFYFYLGFDPTSDSLHIGSLVPLMTMANLSMLGCKPVCLIGDGTALIGDPSGKTEMRKMLSSETISNNCELIKKQIVNIFPHLPITFVNNASWFNNIKYLDFLRDIGPVFRVNEMIKAESYKERLKREDGLSFLEFNYQLLQAYDYLYLHDKYKCVLQIGGDDQWSNMIAGIDLIRKKRGQDVLVITTPLLTTASGKKMGKTESGAIWLDPEKTSPYDFYQYWINTDDRDIARFLKIFTFLDIAEIENMISINNDPREIKKILAFEVTKIVHGEKKAIIAKETTDKLFEHRHTESVPDNMPNIKIDNIAYLCSENKIDVIELIVKAKIINSKTKVRSLIEGGGIYINNIKINDHLITLNNNQKFILIRIGKKKYYKILIS